MRLCAATLRQTEARTDRKELRCCNLALQQRNKYQLVSSLRRRSVQKLFDVGVTVTICVLVAV